MNNHVLFCRQDFKSNETQLFKNVEKLQKESKGVDAAKAKGGMKEAADSAEQIRKWVSQISNSARACYTLSIKPEIGSSFVSDASSGASHDNAPFAILFEGDLKSNPLSTYMLTNFQSFRKTICGISRTSRRTLAPPLRRV